MNQRPMTFSAELVNNEIVIRFTSNNNNQELANKAASQLFASLEQVGIEITRKNLEHDWNLES